MNHAFRTEQTIVSDSLSVPGHSGTTSSLSLIAVLYPLSYGSDQTYFEEIKQFYYRDEFSHQVQEWNRQRTLAIERALQQFLYVQMAKELKNKLLAEAKEYVIKVRTGTRPFSSAQSLSRVQLFATPWTAARQASSTIFSPVISPG